MKTSVSQRHAAASDLGPVVGLRGSRRGFTLLEILVAVAIFAGVLAAFYSSWMAIMRASQTAQKATADIQRSRLAVRALEEALVSAQLFGHNAQHYTFLADTSEEFAALSFVARLPESYPRGGRFLNQPMRRVEFKVEAGPGGGQDLVLRQAPFLFELDPTEDERPLRLAQNVAMFLVEFWGENSTEWEEEWPWTNRLPRLVRFTLATAPEGQRTVNREDVVSRVLVLPPGATAGSVAGVAPPLAPGGPGAQQRNRTARQVPGARPPDNLPPGNPGRLRQPGRPGR